MASIIDQDPFNEYTGNGLSTVYAYEFQLLAAGDLVVTIDDVVVPPSQFVLAGVGIQSGGTVTFNTAPLNLSNVLLSRVLLLERDTDYQERGDLLSATLDNDFNRIWQVLQGQRASMRGALRFPYPEISPELPDAAARANTQLLFDAAGNPYVAAPASGSAADVILDLADPAGASLIGSASYAQIRAYAGSGDTIDCFGRANILDEASGMFVRDPSDITAADDDGTVLIDALGRRWKRKYSGAVNVRWFGAKPSDNTAQTAIVNRDAFRNASLSMKAAWDAWKVNGRSRAVYVPAGNYNLANGFCIPKGCSVVSDGIGVARLTVLPGTADGNPKLPIASLGRVIVDAVAGTTEVTSGAYVQDPAPFIDKLYLNPQNSGVAVSVQGIPGFKIGSLWIQAEVGVDIGGGSGDGIIDNLVVEADSGVGVQLGACQNIIVNNLYTFLCNNPVRYSGDSNNTRINVIQANYTRNEVVLSNDGVSASGAKIGSLVCKQNEQFASFAGVVRLRSAAMDLRIDTMDARNYGGYAIDSETGLGNSVSVGSLKLRQTPFRPGDTVGTTAKGCRVNNSILRVENFDIEGISDSPFELAGAFSTNLLIYGGRYAGNGGATCINITNTANNSSLLCRNVEGDNVKPLINLQNFVNPQLKDNRYWLGAAINAGGRLAWLIPTFSGAMVRCGIEANFNPGGSGVYRKGSVIIANRFVDFSGGTQADIAGKFTIYESPAVFNGVLDIAVAFDAAGGSVNSPFVNAGRYLAVSVPVAYGNASIAADYEN